MDPRTIPFFHLIMANPHTRSVGLKLEERLFAIIPVFRLLTYKHLVPSSHICACTDHITRMPNMR
jgi:hypothetical protein